MYFAHPIPGATMTSVLHVITGLSQGGAEAMLVKLIAATDKRLVSHVVVSLIPGGVHRAAIEGMGVPVRDLGMRRGRPTLLTLLALRRLIARLAPDVIHGWMYHGALAALLAAGGRPVIAGIHSSLGSGTASPWLTRRVIGSLGRLSGRAARVCYVSAVSRAQHEAAGYAPARALVIPNGFDCDRFAPRAADRAAVRAALGVADDAVLIGHLGRHHPVKDHAGLIAAFARVAAIRPDVRLALAGPGVTAETPALAAAVAASGAGDRIFLLGERRDPERLANGFDVLAQSSLSEAFPNVLGEAMACGIPCVATDVGDSARIVGETGLMVPPGDPAALAEGVRRMAALGPEGRARLGRAARARVVERFGLDEIAATYARLYHELAVPAGVAAGAVGRGVPGYGVHG